MNIRLYHYVLVCAVFQKTSMLSERDDDVKPTPAQKDKHTNILTDHSREI